MKTRFLLAAALCLAGVQGAQAEEPVAASSQSFAVLDERPVPTGEGVFPAYVFDAEVNYQFARLAFLRGDLEHARAHLQLGVDQKHGASLTMLCRIEMRGQANPQDPAARHRGMDACMAAAQAGDAEAQEMVGGFYLTGVPGVLPPNAGLARDWLLKATAQGSASAPFNLGEIWEKSAERRRADRARFPQDPRRPSPVDQAFRADMDRAVACYLTALDRGHAPAKEPLSRIGVDPANAPRLGCDDLRPQRYR